LGRPLPRENTMMRHVDTPEVEVLLPVHNEAKSIKQTLWEIYCAVSAVTTVRFILCEDGSSDGTPEVLARLAQDLPIHVFHGKVRKGYSQAVIDGFRAVEAPWVFFLDADGQLDPASFGQAYQLRSDYDVVVGWRVTRVDAWHRRLMSRCFRAIYNSFFRCPLHDPSCPFLLIRREAIVAVQGELVILRLGLWWEFVARVYAAGFRIAELPVNHRRRRSGKTQIYNCWKIPGIAWSHLVGLLIIKRQLAR